MRGLSLQAIKAERAELLELKVLAAELRFWLAMRRFGRKYRVDQPRDGLGRWVYDGGRANRVRLRYFIRKPMPCCVRLAPTVAP